MNLIKWGLGALALVGAVAGTAASADKPEKSGNVWHKAVCSKGNQKDEARCFARVVTNDVGQELVGRAPGGGELSPMVVPSGYGPADLRGAYKITGTGSSASTIAIVDAYGYPNAESNLATYRAQYGLPSCTTSNGCFKKINQNGVQGSYPATDVGWDQEQALDLDMASAMCPNCKILLVQANTASYSDLATAVNRAAATTGVNAISNSYGGGESGTTTYAAAYNHPGIAITASTGDSGYGASFPATSPNVIAVGGTRLVTAANSRGWSETAWTSGGSGCSAVYAKPSFQHDPSCTRRMEADVSAVADPATGVAVYGPTGSGSYGWMVFGGTSASAPIIAGIYGVTGHHPTGAATIYANPSLLFDVTSGTNGSCSISYYCHAGSGYDGPTGLGTPNGPGAF
jgi:subtilase family serine protease